MISLKKEKEKGFLNYEFDGYIEDTITTQHRVMMQKKTTTEAKAYRSQIVSQFRHHYMIHVEIKNVLCSCCTAS